MTLDDSDIETGKPAFPNGNRFLRRKRCATELFGLLAEGDYAKGTVAVAVGAGGEEKLVVLAVGTDILTKLQSLVTTRPCREAAIPCAELLMA
jgi:hypothetical protein